MKKITIIFMSVLMIFASCSMDTSYDDVNDTKEKTNTEIVEDDSENNAEEPSKEKNDSENDDVVENKTWCEIDENVNILGLNYIGYYENSTATFNSDLNNAELVKTTPFAMRCVILSSNGSFREIVIVVKYNEGKLNFSISNQSPYYTIENVNYSESTSTIHINILHK